MADHPELPEENESSPGSLPLTPQPVTAEDRRDLLRTFCQLQVLSYFNLQSWLLFMFALIDSRSRFYIVLCLVLWFQSEILP